MTIKRVPILCLTLSLIPVSYTHLDVYKRQAVERVAASMLSMSRRHKEMILELSESFAELDKRRAQDPPEKAGE